MVSVDTFLRRHFATSARRARPGCVSLEARSGGGTFEQAQEGEARYLFSLSVMGHLEGSGQLSPAARETLRHYYMHLSDEHVVLLKASQDGRHTMTIGPGESPPPDVGIEEEDLQSFCNWTRLAQAVGLKSGKQARKVWSDARQAVWLELERRRQSGD